MRECPACKMSNFSSATACAYCQAVLPAEAVPEAFTMPELEAFVPAAAPEPVAVPEPRPTPAPKPPKPPKRAEAKVGEPEPLPPYPAAETSEPEPVSVSTFMADALAAFTAFIKGAVAYICWLMWGTAVMFGLGENPDLGVILGIVTLIAYGFTANRFFNPPPKLRRRLEIIWFAVGFFPFGLVLLLGGAQSPEEAMVAGANHWVLTVAAVTLGGAYRMRKR